MNDNDYMFVFAFQCVCVFSILYLAQVLVHCGG